MRQIIAAKRLSFADVLSGWHLISASARPDGELLLLASEHAPENHTGTNGKRPKKRTRSPLAYRIYAQQGSEFAAIDLPPTAERFSLAQPLGADQWLAAASRSRDARHAHIYSSTGQRLHSLHLGDAIEDVQTTRAGQIWASYFDEGVFGDEALGHEGAVCLDHHGQPRFSYNTLAQQHGFPFMADCYAMNVCSDAETWLYFYTDFPLVRIVQGQVERVWNTIPVHGAHAFAVDAQRALFAGSYQQQQSLFLVTLDALQVEEAQPVNDQEAPILAVTAFGRGSTLYLKDEQSLYSIDLAQELW